MKGILVAARLLTQIHVIRFWATFGANCTEGSFLTDWNSADRSMSVTKEDVILPLNARQHCEYHRSSEMWLNMWHSKELVRAPDIGLITERRYISIWLKNSGRRKKKSAGSYFYCQVQVIPHFEMNLYSKVNVKPLFWAQCVVHAPWRAYMFLKHFLS